MGTRQREGKAVSQGKNEGGTSKPRRDSLCSVYIRRDEYEKEGECLKYINRSSNVLPVSSKPRHERNPVQRLLAIVSGVMEARQG